MLYNASDILTNEHVADIVVTKTDDTVMEYNAVDLVGQWNDGIENNFISFIVPDTGNDIVCVPISRVYSIIFYLPED